MDLQFVIVALIVLAALFFAGRAAVKRARSFRVSKRNCGTACGCGSDDGSPAKS